MRIKNIVILLTTVLLTACVPVSTSMPAETILPTSSVTNLPPVPTKTLNAKEILSLIPIPPSTPTFIPAPSERADYDNISGKYQLDRGENSGCFLNVVLEPTYEMGFYLFCNRGAPSYNSGSATGKILISNNIAVYTPSYYFLDTDTEPNVSPRVCNIVFQFEENKVTVTQLGTDFACGFGHAVYADGVYQLVDKKPPQLDCVFDENSCSTPTAKP